MKKICACLVFYVFLPFSAFAADVFWVDDNGTETTWANCESDEPISGTAACTLATANSNITAGETVYLREGTYSVDTANISPSNEGTSDNKITYQAYTGETPEFTRSSSNSPAISISGKDYIIVDGITGTDLATWIRLTDANYNEIRNCTFSGSTNYDHCIRIWNGGSGEDYSTHNWLHDNSFSGCGGVSSGCNDEQSMFKVGENTSDGGSNYNTFEDNAFSYGGHDCGKNYTRYNVFRNNTWHNEGWITDPNNCASGDYGPDSNGKYGNRNVEMVAYESWGGGDYKTWILFEGNKFRAGGTSVDDDGSDSAVLSSQNNIFRYNECITAASNGLLLKHASTPADNNRIYNNTIAFNGRHENSPNQRWQGMGIRFYCSSGNYGIDNVIKNNILYDNPSGDFGSASDGSGWSSACSESAVYSNNTISDNYLNANGDPLFINTNESDLTSMTSPDLNLQAYSNAIDAGSYLTQTNGTGTDSTALIVDDALFFQDGSWGSSLSNIQADWVCVNTVSNCAQISSINYGTDTITLASPLTWTDGNSVWVQKISDGTTVIIGSAPDQGAHEYGDEIAPEFYSASIAEDGVTITINFTEAVNMAGYDADDLDLDCDGLSGSDISLTYSSGSGTSAIVMSSGATIIEGTETCTLDFDADVNDDDIEDIAGNDLATFSNETVTNNSIQPIEIAGVYSESGTGSCASTSGSGSVQ